MFASFARRSRSCPTSRHISPRKRASDIGFASRTSQGKSHPRSDRVGSMDLATIFRSDDVFVGITCTNKNRALQLVCEKAARSLRIEGDKLVDVIRKREDLGSTGIGRGIAVPHAAVSNVE